MCHNLMQMDHSFQQLWQVREKKKEKKIKTKKHSEFLHACILEWAWVIFFKFGM